jgi:hypothetical protein
LCTSRFDTLHAALVGDHLPANRAVRFSTRDSTIVAIAQQSGLSAELRGMALGVATIVARAVADTTLEATSQVTVSGCESPPPLVTIKAITVAGTATRVDTASVTGRIDVHFAVHLMPPNTVARLRIGAGAAPMLDCQAFDAATQTGVCTLDTAAKDDRGALLYANGPQPVSVLMVLPNGLIIAATQRILVFNNTS